DYGDTRITTRIASMEVDFTRNTTTYRVLPPTSPLAITITAEDQACYDPMSGEGFTVAVVVDFEDTGRLYRGCGRWLNCRSRARFDRWAGTHAAGRSRGRAETVFRRPRLRRRRVFIRFRGARTAPAGQRRRRRHPVCQRLRWRRLGARGGGRRGRRPGRRISGPATSVSAHRNGTGSGSAFGVPGGRR